MFVGEPAVSSRRQRAAATRRAACAPASWVVAKVARELGINVTGGSSSVADAWEVLRLAAATARAQLLGAASLHWKQPVDELTVKRRRRQPCRRASAPTTASCAKAAAATPTGEVRLKPRERVEADRHAPRRASTSSPRATARRASASTCACPGMLYAVIRHCPMLGGSPGAVDVDAALKLPGVERVVRLGALCRLDRCARGRRPQQLACAARRRRRSRSSGGSGRPAALDSARDRRTRSSSARATPHATAAASPSTRRGDVDAGRAARGARSVEQVYRAPYLAHAAMEPINCTARSPTARSRSGCRPRCRAWRARSPRRSPACRTTAVTVHVTYLGGGFGRRLEVDFVGQAVRIALETGGRPVQLRLVARGRPDARLLPPGRRRRCCAPASTREGRPLALRDHQRRRRDHAALARARPAAPRRPGRPPDKTTSEGLFDLPYDDRHTSASPTSRRAAACRSATGARSAIRTTPSSASASSTSSRTRPGRIRSPTGWRC